MMTVGIPKIEKYIEPKRLSKWQKYLKGKKVYDSIREDGWPKFKDLPKRGGNGQSDWILIATMDFNKF